MIEFDCEGCGVHVVDLGSVTAPTSRQCVTCEWLCKFIRDPDEFWQAYQRCMGERREMLADKDASGQAEPCVPGSVGVRLGSSSGGPDEKPSDSSS